MSAIRKLAVPPAALALTLAACAQGPGAGTTPPADTTSPSVSLSASTTRLTIAGGVTLTATAADDVGVAGVEFREGGTLLAADTTSPYEPTVSYSTSADNGASAFTARAFDAAGNSAATAVPVGVTVSIPVAWAGTV